MHAFTSDTAKCEHFPACSAFGKLSLNLLVVLDMDEAVDGEYQNCKAKGGAYTREHFFGRSHETAQMVSDLTDEDIWRLNRGGHDQQKVYAAYHDAIKNSGRPVVILAKTVKGYGMGNSGESANPAHQVKKLDLNIYGLMGIMSKLH